MQDSLQIEWLDRVRRHIAAGTTDMDPAVARVEVSRYTDLGRLEREQDKVFGRHPAFVGFASQLAKAGDFITNDLTGRPILVVRDREGRLNAFLNVCRHRGARLVADRAGCGRRSLVCPYHAWTYDLSGQLRGIPHEQGFAGLDKATQGLVRLPVAEVFGLVFVFPHPSEEYDFEWFFESVRADLDGFGLGSHVLHDEREIGVRANWKIVVEGGLETYHVQHAHRETIAPMFADNVSVADRLGQHMRLYFTKRVAAELVGQPLDNRSVRNFGNPLYYIFPNLIILIQPDHATVMAVHPDGPGSCSVHGGALIPEPARTEKANAYWDRNVKIFWDALDEDFRMGEAIQMGFAAGANTHLTFGRFEQGCAWFHAAMDRVLDASAP